MAEATTGSTAPERYSRVRDSVFAERPRERSWLVERILEDPRMHDHRDGFLSCAQCGTCTSGCPAARFTDYSPREVARRALEGDESLLEDDSLWNCFYCYTCQSRCPCGNSVAVLNQILRGLQIETGYGLQHVATMSEWGETFYTQGMGGTPHVFFADLYDAWGPRWRQFIVERDELRNRLGLGDMFPSERALDEVRTIMDETGFRSRLDAIEHQGAATRERPPKG